MYIVAGATGHTGRAAAESLLAQGKPVTVLVRSEDKGQLWRAKGGNIAVGTLDDSESLTRILSDAEGAYLLIPPNFIAGDFFQTQQRVADSLATAVANSGVPHVVFLSSIGAHQASGTGPIVGLHYAESALAPVARNITFLRPAYFLENWEPVLRPAMENGVLPTFLTPNRKIPMIATEDIGRFAAESLIHPATGRRVLELRGPEDYCPDDIAAILTAILNRDVRAQQVPLSAVVPTFTNFGFSESAARTFEQMYAGINSGHVAYEHEEHEGIDFGEGVVNAAEVLRKLLARSQQAHA